MLSVDLLITLIEELWGGDQLYHQQRWTQQSQIVHAYLRFSGIGV